MQPLTPASLLNKRGDLVSQKRAALAATSATTANIGQITPSHQQYNQEQTKVKSMLKQFEMMHQNGGGGGAGDDGDDDEEEDPFGNVNSSINVNDSSMGILPISKSFDPPTTTSIGTQLKIGAEQQQIKASKMQNAQMGYSLSLPPLTQSGTADTTPLIAQNNLEGLTNWTDNQYGKYLGASTLAQGPVKDMDLYRLGGTATPSWAMPASMASPSWKPITPIKSDDLLMTKLNYMINLLEEQKDEKTGNMTEEIVLYSFLGVFMIFIVDSFSRVGKYVR